MIKYQELIRNLKAGKILPLYLFYGEEEFLIQEAVDLIIKKVVDPGASDFNFSTLYCRDTTVSDIVNIAQTLPFMSEKRLVIAKELEALKAADAGELVSYLASPSPSTCLVMVSNQRKYDKKSIISSVEAAGGAVTAFYQPYDSEVAAWISGWARSRGLSMQADAVQYIKQAIGNDLQKIHNELQKVEIYVEDRKEVSLADVRLVVGDFREYTSFDLVEAIGRKNGEKAFQILAKILREGEQPVSLLGMVAWNFRRLFKAKGMEAAGMEYGEIKKKMGIFAFQSAAFQEQMRRFTLDELRDAFNVMLSTDSALKSSGVDNKLLLDRMILKLCGGEQRA